LYLALFCLGGLASISSADTLAVPGQFPTIQAAIDAAVSGDMILVSAGTYPETLNTRRKKLDLVSVSGSSATIIDGQRRSSVIEFNGGGSIRGFTITNGLAEGGGGVRIFDISVPTIVEGNIIKNNQAGLFVDSGRGGGIFAYNTINLSITNNTIRENVSLGDGGGVTLDGYQACRLAGNYILANYAYLGGGGAEVAYADVVDNIIADNVADHFGAGLMVSGGDFSVVGNTVAYNRNNNNFQHPAGILAGNVTSSITVARNLVIHNSGLNQSGVGLACHAGRVECNDSWGNDQDYSLGAACDTTNGRNISLDPFLCAAPNPEFNIRQDSPCAPAHSGGCGRIGRGEATCGSTAARRQTWGNIKHSYR
jgi:hypothetical protein